MSNQETNTGPTSGGTNQAPAGRQLRDGERLCPSCRGAGFVHIVDESTVNRHDCGTCKGTGVEPSGAPHPSTSMFGPPVPCSDARRVAAAGTDESLDLANAVRVLRVVARQVTEIEQNTKWWELAKRRAAQEAHYWANLFVRAIESQAAAKGGPTPR